MAFQELYKNSYRELNNKKAPAKVLLIFFVIISLLISMPLLFRAKNLYLDDIEKHQNKTLLQLLGYSLQPKQIFMDSLVTTTGFGIAAYLACWKRFYIAKTENTNDTQIEEKYIAEPLVTILQRLKKDKTKTPNMQLFAYGASAVLSQGGLLALSLWKPEDYYLNLFLQGANVPLGSSAALCSALFLEKILSTKSKQEKTTARHPNKKSSFFLYESSLIGIGANAAFMAKHRRISNAIGQMIIPIMLSTSKIS